MAKAFAALSWKDSSGEQALNIDVDYFLNSKACAEFNNSRAFDAEDGMIEAYASGLNWTIPIGSKTVPTLAVPEVGVFRVLSAVPVEGYGISVTTFIGRREAA